MRKVFKRSIEAAARLKQAAQSAKKYSPRRARKQVNPQFNRRIAPLAPSFKTVKLPWFVAFSRFWVLASSFPSFAFIIVVHPLDTSHFREAGMNPRRADGVPDQDSTGPKGAGRPGTTDAVPEGAVIPPTFAALAAAGRND
jgi:hypothetical protein